MRRALKCPTGKVWSYVTAADALLDLPRMQRSLRQRDSDSKVPDRVYQCDVCHFWHVTSSERQR